MSQYNRLQHAEWSVGTGTPYILHASEAAKLTPHDHEFCMVTWYCDEPVDFSPFEFTRVNFGSYEISVADRQNRYLTALEADEWVVVLKRY